MGQTQARVNLLGTLRFEQEGEERLEYRLVAPIHSCA